MIAYLDCAVNIPSRSTRINNFLDHYSKIRLCAQENLDRILGVNRHLRHVFATKVDHNAVLRPVDTHMPRVPNNLGRGLRHQTNVDVLLPQSVHRFVFCQLRYLVAVYFIVCEEIPVVLVFTGTAKRSLPAFIAERF